MLTSNGQLGYVLTRGGGQAVQGGLSCPPPRISKRMDNQKFLLHHLLQKYLVERDINFISVNLKSYFKRSVGLRIDKGWGGGGGQAVHGGLSCPPPRISVRIDNPQFLLHHLLQEYLLKEMLTLFQSIWDAYFKRSVGLHIDKGWGASCPGRFILPPPHLEFQREWIIRKFYYTIYYRNI